MRHSSSNYDDKHPQVPTVEAVIPSWNGASILHYALDSLARQDYPKLSVTLVDNGSDDDTVRIVGERWPTVRILRLPINTGFAYATNYGIARSTADLLALINNDVELHPSWVSEMVETLNHHPMAGSATGRMLRWRNRTTIDNIGLFCHWDGSCGPLAAGLDDDGTYDHPRIVFGACAGAGMYRRTAFELVGNFDETFFAYVEDVDWSFRAQQLRLECRYVPNALSYHLGSSTGSRLGVRKLHLSVKNSCTLILKNWPAWALAKHWHSILWRLGSMARHSVREDHVLTYCAAILHVLRSLPDTRRQRRVIQRSATATQSELIAVVEPGRQFRRRQSK